LGWHHKIPLEVGLASTFQWFVDSQESIRK
jgi:hypothetical protein